MAGMPLPLASRTTSDRAQWIFYVVIIFNGLSFALLLLFLPETQYIANPADPCSGRVGVKYWPWQRPREYLATAIRPLVISRYVALTLPATYYGIVFGFFVGATVVQPRLLTAEYGFSTQAVGLSYLAYGIGSVLGKTAGGWVGDQMVLWKQTRTGERHPEYRLWPMVGLSRWQGDVRD
jgi:nitrate/nitrite transporter NarK